jgi:repressor LexA
MRELPPVTQAVYRFIVAYIDTYEGVAPTRHEIASSLGIAEGGYIRFHLLKLEKAGLIVLVPGTRRGIRLPQAEPVAPTAAPTPEVNAYDYFVSQWGAQA